MYVPQAEDSGDEERKEGVGEVESIMSHINVPSQEEVSHRRVFTVVT